VFRVAVATYLAVHGLREQPVHDLDLPAGVHPVRLDFETNDPTDDIKVTLGNGQRAFVSAKRRAGDDRHLRETVIGWVDQLPHCAPDDLLVLAVEDLAGPLKELGAALSRRRVGQPLERSVEQRALAAVTAYVPEELVDDILDRARVLNLPSVTREGQARSLMTALAGYIVADGNGTAAVNALEAHVSRQAGAALSSTLTDWVAILNHAGLEVIPDAAGAAGMRAAARTAAITAYQTALAAERGRIDLSLLADDLPPVIVDNLIDGLQIGVDRGEPAQPTGTRRARNEPLLPYVRRWRRLLIVGQPGVGKSVALREIAAHCAEHPFAPLPLRVSLPKLLSSAPDCISLDTLIAAATTTVADDQRASLAGHLRSVLDQGRVILLCDSLDECGARAPWVAQQLADILETLHPDAGFILTTRANAERTATRLGLPRVELAAPNDLDSTVDAVLSACATTRAAAPSREAWLQTRRQWIQEAKDQHSDLLRVPLLAILLTLICADTADAKLPAGRAAILYQAVEQSITRWERARSLHDAHRPWAADLSQGMLLGGYIVLGRALDARATVPKANALSALSDYLQSPKRWHLAPARAQEVAADVLRFWDEHVAVFVLNADDELTARSRVFTEISSAMWTVDCDDAALQQWLRDSLRDSGAEGGIALAVDLNAQIIDTLLGIGEHDQAATIFTATLVRTGVVTLTEEQTGRCLRQLVHHAHVAITAGPALTEEATAAPSPKQRLQNALQLRREENPQEPGWRFAKLACLLPLTEQQRHHRADVLRAAGLRTRNHAILTAVAALTDAATDDRPLTGDEHDTVRQVMETPLPSEGTMVHETRRRVAWTGGERLAPGIEDVAGRLVSHLDEFPSGTAKWIFDVSMRTTPRVNERIDSGLKAAGIDTTHWQRTYPGVTWAAWGEEHEAQKKTLLQEIRSLHKEPSPSRPMSADLVAAHASNKALSAEEGASAGLWSLRELSDFLTATGYLKAGVPDLRQAFRRDTPALRRDWLQVLAAVYELDTARLAVQGDHVLRQITEASGPAPSWAQADWTVVFTEPPHEREVSETAASTLTPEQQATLVTCLTTQSDWLAWAAADVLTNISTPAWNTLELYQRDMTSYPRNRAALTYAVAILTAGIDRRHLLDNSIRSTNGDYRLAARYSISIDPTLDPHDHALQTLDRDEDWSVRRTAARDIEPACTHWTCNTCRTRNDLSTEDCVGCTTGTRPD